MYNIVDMKRRIKAYRVANNSEVAEPAVQDYFKEQGIKFFKENTRTLVKDALNGFKIYIERVSSVSDFFLSYFIICRTKSLSTT